MSSILTVSKMQQDVWVNVSPLMTESTLNDSPLITESTLNDSPLMDTLNVFTVSPMLIIFLMIFLLSHLPFRSSFGWFLCSCFWWNLLHNVQCSGLMFVMFRDPVSKSTSVCLWISLLHHHTDTLTGSPLIRAMRVSLKYHSILSRPCLVTSLLEWQDLPHSLTPSSIQPHWRQK